MKLNIYFVFTYRQPKHLLDFLLAELGTSGSMDGNQQLIIKGRFQSKQIENVLRRWEKHDSMNSIGFVYNVLISHYL